MSKSAKTHSQIKAADVTWQGDTPESTEFSDIYFNVSQGVAECEYVFLQGNQLENRFQNHSESTFVIAETGFGTGLNFLSAAQLFLNKNDLGTLHFISIEKFPLAIDDLSNAHKHWPQFAKISQDLREQYPPIAPGYHQLELAQGRVKLTLIFADAIAGYQQLAAKVDAWFLDGFAPSKNPEMWNQTLYNEIGRLSHPGTTLATFTAAGDVRRGLQDAGFTINKRKGFGRKREMVTATFNQCTSTTDDPKPWFTLPEAKVIKNAAIIGAGLAGCSTAYALAQRGINVTVFEAKPEAGLAGSGNPQGALYAKLPQKPTTQGDLHLAGFLYTTNWLERLDSEHELWSQCGVVQLALTEKEIAKQQQSLNNLNYPDEIVHPQTAEQLSKIAGLTLTDEGVFFPMAGWAAPALLCRKLLNHPNITLKANTQIDKLSEVNQGWQLTDSQGQLFTYSSVIICSAEEANRFPQSETLPLKTIRGQVSITPMSDSWPELETVICGDGYISPAKDERYCFGATFDLKSKQLNVTESDHQLNLKKLGRVLPQLQQAIENHPEQLNGRTAFRCSTPDYMPIVGPVADFDYFLETYARLRKDKNWRFSNAPAKHHNNLFVNTGHGSKGLITAPISAELIAAQLSGGALPLPKVIIDAINPARFIVKNLIKQAI